LVFSGRNRPTGWGLEGKIFFLIRFRLSGLYAHDRFVNYCNPSRRTQSGPYSHIGLAPLFSLADPVKKKKKKQQVHAEVAENAEESEEEEREKALERD